VKRPRTKRPPPAEHLTDRMRAKRTSVARLARHANVTELHVRVMRNCARDWHQVAYLIEVLDGLGYPPGTFSTSSESTRVSVQVSDAMHDRLQQYAETDDISVNQLVIDTLQGRHGD